jgi:hypothetical protein
MLFPTVSDRHETNYVSPSSTRFQPDIQSLASSALLFLTPPWQKHKSTACSLLYSSCSIDLQGHINDIWEPTTIWETLSRQADESKQRGGPILLRRQLQLEKYNGEGSVSAYVSRILSYRDRLAHTPQKLSKDEVIAYTLLVCQKAGAQSQPLLRISL